jgi:peptide/nickel transport system permease protein
MAIFGPIIYPKPFPRDVDNILAPMSWDHPFGTDFQGTDVLALLMSGARYVIGVAVLAGLIAVVIGVAFGLLSGLRRGVVDSVLMRLADFNLTLPDLPLLLVLSTVWNFSSPWAMGFVLGIMNWGPTARAVRSQVLSLRERGFIEAARGLGLSTPHIAFRELLPPVAPYVSMTLLLRIIGSVYTQVGLFFLGAMPVVSNHWGVMLNQAVFNYGAMISGAARPWMLAPLLAILLFTLAIVFVVDAMDEVFNPRLREE